MKLDFSGYHIVWDTAKEASNRSKHGVSFDEAMQALDDEHADTAFDEAHSSKEDRWKTTARSPRNRLLVIITTEPVYRIIRIVSAREANKRERTKHYEK